MLIKLKCIDDKCAFTYSISEKEFLEYGKIYHSNCMICGSLLKVDNLEKIIELDIYKKANNYINKWVAEIGWDNTIDLIKRNKHQSCYRIYVEILEKRGFKIK